MGLHGVELHNFLQLLIVCFVLLHDVVLQLADVALEGALEVFDLVFEHFTQVIRDHVGVHCLDLRALSWLHRCGQG